MPRPALFPARPEFDDSEEYAAMLDERWGTADDWEGEEITQTDIIDLKTRRVRKPEPDATTVINSWKPV